MTLSQEMPVNRLRPAANSISRISVPPVKPRAWVMPPPTTAPSIPPGSCGSAALSVYNRVASIPLLASSTMTKPTTTTAYDLRSVSGACSMR